MRRLLRFASLSLAGLGLTYRALLLALAARVCLWVLPFQSSRRLLAWIAAMWPGPSTPAAAVQAVERACRCVPGSTCLVRAMTLEALLRSGGLAANLQIGVSLKAGAHFEAHAWVDLNGARLPSGDEARRFIPIFNGSLIP